MPFARHVASRRGLSLPLAVLALAALLLPVGCEGGDEPPESPGRSVEVVMSDLAFDPVEITMARGERVELRLSNRGSMEHDFTVDEMPVDDISMTGGMEGGEHAAHGGGSGALHAALASEEAGTLSFEPTEAGSFEYYCTVEGHRAAGMTGTLVVE